MTGLGPDRALAASRCGANHTPQLSAALRGRVVLPGDDDYDTERAGWNLSVDHHPEVIVVAEDAGDVAAAVQYAAEADLPVAVQSTGHGVSVPADGAVYVNTGRLTGLRVDASARVARMGAGLRWGQVVAAAGEHGLAPLCGSSATVGVMGYLTGGGLPVVGRTFGFAANAVRSLDVVTADGRLRTVTPSVEPGLYWALRGGKSNFGVVVAAELDLLALPRLFGGSLLFDGRHTERVLRNYLVWAPEQPEEMNSSVILVRFPDLPQMPAEVRGRFFVNIRIAYAGDPATGERLVAPLRAMGPAKDEVGDMPYTDIAEIYHEPSRPTPARTRTGLFRELDDNAADQLIDLAGPDRKDFPFGGIELRHLGGALARPSARSSAVGVRDAAFNLFTSMPAPFARNDLAEVLVIQDDLMRRLSPWDTGTMLPGFMFSHETRPGDVRRSYAKADFSRLVDLKSVHDPTNLFRVNHNIPPN